MMLLYVRTWTLLDRADGWAQRGWCWLAWDVLRCSRLTLAGLAAMRVLRAPLRWTNPY